MAQPSLDNRLNAAPRPWIRNSQTPPKSELRYSKPSSGNSQTLPKSELRYGCRNTSEGTVPKRQNPSKIRAQAQQKTVRSAGPKQHLWSPLRREKKKRAPVRRPKTWRNLAWTNAAPRPWIRNSQTPPKSELRYSKPSSGNSQTLPKSELRYRKNSLVCSSLTPPPQARQRGRRILFINIYIYTFLVTEHVKY